MLSICIIFYISLFVFKILTATFIGKRNLGSFDENESEHDPKITFFVGSFKALKALQVKCATPTCRCRNTQRQGPFPLYFTL